MMSASPDMCWTGESVNEQENGKQSTMVVRIINRYFYIEMKQHNKGRIIQFIQGDNLQILEITDRIKFYLDFHAGHHCLMTTVF